MRTTLLTMKPTNRCLSPSEERTHQDNNQKFLKTVIEEMNLEMTPKNKKSREELKMKFQTMIMARYHQLIST
jgi:hypothetical protein